MKNKSGFNSKCVHAGTAMQDVTHAANTPIVASTAFKYLDLPMQYPRMFNLINQMAVANKLAALEKAETGIIFSSGMGVISAVLMAFLKPGDELLIQSNIYGGTYMFIHSQLEKIGVNLKTFPTTIDVNLEEYITEKTKMVYIETPANPLLDIVDIESITTVCKKHNLLSVIDNTFASPYCQTPIELGVDLVMHSGTKYLAGHSDVMFGAVVGSKDWIEQLRPTAIAFGSVLDAKAASEAEKSMKTLGLRMKKHTENAMEIALVLSKHPKITKVLYPGLKNHKGHEVAKKQMKAFGAIVTFELHESIDAVAFQKKLNFIMPSVSLGGVESLITSPFLTSHKFVASEDRQKMGISNQMLRLSVGIEEVEDIMVDINQAINAVGK